MQPDKLELVCPAGSLPALKTAVDNGADCVYMGFRDDTNARNFTGLNFAFDNAKEGVRYAHAKGKKVLLALNTYPQDEGWQRWTKAIDNAAELGMDAVILADPGLMQAAKPSTCACIFRCKAGHQLRGDQFTEMFGIQRAVVPRVGAGAGHWLMAGTEVEIELFGFGPVRDGGRALRAVCHATGDSPNTRGVCSPHEAVRWQDTPKGLESRLNGILIDRYDADENAGYPTLCKGRFDVQGETYYAIEEPASLNTLELLPELMRMGIATIKIEGRQRSPAYVEQVTKVWRQAIYNCQRDTGAFAVKPAWMAELGKVSEGQ